MAVIAGKDKGKTGRVLQVLPRSGRVVVEGVNLVRRRNANPLGNSGGSVLTKESPVHKSSVQLTDPASGLPTRVAVRFLEDGTKVRVSKKSGSVIARPALLEERKSGPRPSALGPNDTSPEEALKQTYSG